MKNMVLAGLMLGLAAAAFAIDFNLDARTDLLYTSYMHNSAYNALAAIQTLTAVNVFEKLRLKAKASIEPVKFDFDGRVYLKPSNETLAYTIDSAYFSFESGPLVIYAGKQRIKWGTGYFWNPSDNLQPAKDVFRTTEDLEGILAVRAEISNEFVTPSIILMPRINVSSSLVFDNLDVAVQLYKLVGTCDLFLNYIYKNNTSYSGASVSWDNSLFVLNAEAGSREKVYDDPMWGLVIESQVLNFVIGASKTAGDFLFAAEYFRNNSGISNQYYYEQQVALGRLMPAMDKQNYLAYTINYTWDQRFAFTLTGMHGLDDGTSYLFPSVSYIENQNFDVMVSLLQNLTGSGVKEGNYSTPFYSAMELRINAYF